MQLTRPFGRPFLLALCILAGLVIVGELVLRVPAVDSRLPAPSYGSNHDQFEIQLASLQRFADDGPIDCLFFGSSMVWRDINPAIIEQIYADEIGENIRCYALGINGLTASIASTLFDYLVKTYHPHLIVYGISPRDFKVIDHQALDIPKLAWLHYARGSFNVSGWLLDHSRLTQYAFYAQHWVENDPVNKLARREQFVAGTRVNGYGPSNRSLSMLDLEQEKARIADLYEHYAPVPSELAGLQHMLAYHHPPDSQVLLVELPIYPYVVTQLMGQEVYQDFNKDIFEHAQAVDARYWPTTQLNLIVTSGWSDFNHLNHGGSAVFSNWLGHRLVEAVQSGELMPIASDG